MHRHTEIETLRDFIHIKSKHLFFTLGCLRILISSADETLQIIYPLLSY